MRIALLGAECTGKTQLAAELVQALSRPPGTALRIDEVLRSWCAEHARTPQRNEQEHIAQRQAALVVDTPDPGYLIADTSPLMTAIYSDVLFEDRSLYPFAVQHQRLYDLTLVMGLDLPWVADGIQRDGPWMRALVDARLREVLQSHALAFTLIYGHGIARTACALQAIAHHQGTAKQGKALIEKSWQWICEKCSDAQCEHRLFSALIKHDSVRG